MSDFLQRMARLSAARAAAAPSSYAPSELDRPVLPLTLRDFDIIAEIKENSPSAGRLADGEADRVQRAADYVRGGAAAISVLTEPSSFGGDLAHLREVVDAAPGVPVMRKDFLTDPVQIVEARAAGASGVLLIAAMLADDALRSMLDCAAEHSMFVLLEAFDAADLGRCTVLLRDGRYRRQAEAARLLIGVNSRDLRSLHVNPARLGELAPLLPPDAVCVAESGLHTAEDAARVRGLGYRAGLVGTALMQSPRPAALIREMLDAARSGVAA